MKYIICIFALWIGWFGHQPTRGKSTAPSILSMVDYFKRVDKMNKKKDLSLLIKQFKEVHDDRYGYNLITEDNYVNSHAKVPVICKEHNYVFYVSPTNHLRGKGCPKCAKTYIPTTEEFVEKARIVHGDSYDYSKTVYKNAKTKICIICKKCGNEFWQTPDNHLQGKGCNKCMIKKISLKQADDKETFIRKANLVHKNKYSYTKVEYVNNRTKVTIICPIHGDFKQTPSVHLCGSGCNKCANEKRGKYNLSTKEEFIKRAKEIHGDKYGYDEVEYINAKKKVKIYCKKHNEYFYQEPFVHLKGCGCPYCKTSKGEELVEKFLLKNNIKHKRQYIVKNMISSKCANKKFFVDFYLPDYNTFIEFNGEQHYKKVDAWGGEKSLRKQKRRDSALRKLCVHQNITLVEIKNSEINNIENILGKILNISNG